MVYQYRRTFRIAVGSSIKEDMWRIKTLHVFLLVREQKG